MAPPITELASGTIDGSNTLFKTSRDYKPGSLRVYLDGFIGHPRTELGGRDFQMDDAPLVGSVVSVYYRPI